MTREDMLKEADRAAAELGAQGGPAELLAAAADGEVGADMRAELLAHEIAVAHGLMLRLAAAAHDLLDWSDESAAAAAGDTEPADLLAARIAAASSRLMEQVRLGLAALRLCRPHAVEGDELWVALHWLDDRCSDEELMRRIAAVRAANRPQSAGGPQTSERARNRRAAAADLARRLAAEAGVPLLARAIADPAVGVGFGRRLFAHELGAAHALMMRLSAAAGRALDRNQARNQARGPNGDQTARSEPAEALRLTGVIARLGDRYRRGHVTLLRLAGAKGAAATPIWGGSGGPNPDPTAGHGVHPSNSPAPPPNEEAA